MILKTKKWILMPFCVLFGIALLVAFVSLSQDYLSEYLVRNSKDLVGHKIDLQMLATHLKEPKFTTFTKAHGNSKIILTLWSVDCAPCLKKLEKFKDLSPTALVFPINTDTQNKRTEAQSVFEATIPGATFLYDENGVLMRQLKIDYVPTNIELDQDGFIQKIEVGDRS